jgi:hypothetical protein
LASSFSVEMNAPRMREMNVPKTPSPNMTVAIKRLGCRGQRYASTQLSSGKPFKVPNDLYGPTCDASGCVCDGLVRAWRVEDGWQAGNPADRKFLLYGQGVSSSQSLALDQHGAAFLSVSPDPTSYAGKDVYFQADLVGTGLPVFRVFRINEPSTGQLVPEPVCKGTDSGCPFVQLSDGRRQVGVLASVGPTTREIVVVASAASTKAKFDWSFGDVQPKLTIIEPVRSLPALIGNNVVRNKFAIKLSHRDENNQPISGLEAAQDGMQITVTNPAATGGGCTLKGGDDFTLWPLSAGSNLVVASLPVSCYPTVYDPDPDKNRLDLTVTLGAETATSPGSLLFSKDGTQAVVLALDTSGSMNSPPEKLTIAKWAANAMIRSLVPPSGLTTSHAALVTFNEDASTVLDWTLADQSGLPKFDAAIASMTAGGWTSIGDGLLESQFLLSDFDEEPFKSTGGTLFFVPNPHDMFHGLADAFLGSASGALGYDRVLSAALDANAVLAIPVEPGARQLRVNVVSSEAEYGYASLRSPSGAPSQPITTEQSGHSSSFWVIDPEPGVWELSTLTSPDSGIPIFAEATVDSSIGLFATLDVSDILPMTPGGDSLKAGELTAWTGSDLKLLASVIDDGPLTDCEIGARVFLPDESTVVRLLHDDGQHGDGAAGDGLFGGLFTQTGQAGLYSARIVARCVLPSGAEVRREKLAGVTLASMPDIDEDGAPDHWEELHGLADAPLGDADGDGLSDLLEFSNGTDPNSSDSDGGGESDASEIAAGRDPRDPADDALPSPDLVPVAGNTLAYLPGAMVGVGITLSVERAASVEGPFQAISVETGRTRLDAVDRSAQNDVPACYRMRAVRGTTVSAWSQPACVTPRLDPVAPRVSVVAAPSRSFSRDIEIAIRAIDAVLHTDGAPPPIELGTRASGVEAIRVWFGAGSGDGIAWQAPADMLSLRLPDQAATLIQVQARDRAGNVGPRASSCRGRCSRRSIVRSRPRNGPRT